MAFGPVNTPGVAGSEADAALQQAALAHEKALEALNKASAADDTAHAALEAANAASSTAGTAKTTADEALEVANGAAGSLSTAQAAATSAEATAQEAKRLAEAASQAASNAQQTANDVSQALTDLNSTINTVPSQAGILYYTGSAQTPSWNGYDSTKMTLSVTAKTNAGTYDATVTPKDGFKWPDGTNTAKTITWKINPATVALPTVSTNPTYTGSAVSPTWNGYDTAKMTLNSGGSGTNVGNYTAKFQTKANYQWPDGSTGEKSVSWSVSKAAGSLSLDKTSLTLNVSSLTGTISVTRAGDGTISATSSNTSVATVSVSGNTVTVTGKAKGSATITIAVAAGTNHTAPANKTCSVTVTLPTKTLNDNDWSVVKQASDGGNGASYWAVGDTKTITINGKVGNFTFSNLSVQAFILGFNHNSAKEGSNRIHFQIGKISGKMVGLCDDKYGSNVSTTGYFSMNSSATNVGGWKDSYMRKTLLGNSNTPTSPLSNSLMAALPSDLRSNMKSVTKYTDNVGNGTGHVAGNVTSTTDYLFLLSNYEVQGSDGYANNTEKNSQAQYDYYKAGNSKIAYKHSSTSTAVWWWLRSPCYGSNTTSAVSTPTALTATATPTTRRRFCPALLSNPPQSYPGLIPPAKAGGPPVERHPARKGRNMEGA